MNKIKIIFTGGTIGSVVNNNVINTNESTQFLLIKNYSGDKSIFTTSNILNILSENAVIDNIITMAKEIKKAQSEGCKAVILTHGTDTLAHTGAYLSFLLNDIKIPVVLIASNYPISDSRANGNINFKVAVKLIQCGKLKPAVYVVFKNSLEDFVSIHLAVRMREPAPYDDDFYSPHNLRFAKYENGKFTFENTIFERTVKSFSYKGKNNVQSLFLMPYTGLDYSLFSKIKPTFILQQFYHSGTANASKYNNYSLIEFAKRCKDNGIPFYACNITKKEANYASTDLIKDSGVKFLYSILPHVALAKLNIAYGMLDEKEVDDFLNTNITGEILD